MLSEKKRAVLLLSGGLDSTTVLALAKAEGYSISALSFRYGQNHEHEAAQAQMIARHYGVSDHTIVDIDLAVFGQSALTADIEVPKANSVEQICNRIPVTYVPARNTIFLSYALALAEVRKAAEIFIGVNALDYSGYPDCRPEYISAFQALADLATKTGVEGSAMEIRAPLLHLTKAEIIARGLELGVDYSMTTSCYDPDANNRACGRCDACLLRLKGFDENGIKDPIDYQCTE